MKILEKIINEFAMQKDGEIPYLSKKAIEYSIFILYVYENRINNQFELQNYIYEMIKKDLEIDFHLNDIRAGLTREHFKQLERFSFIRTDKAFEVWWHYVDALIDYANMNVKTDWAQIDQLLLATLSKPSPEVDGLSVIAAYVLRGKENYERARILNLSEMKSNSLTNLRRSLIEDSEFGLNVYFKTFEQQREQYFLQKLSYLFLEEYNIDVAIGDVQAAIQYEPMQQDVIFYTLADSMMNPVLLEKELQALIERLNDNGAVICFAPSNALYKKQYVDTRQWLVEQRYLQAVIQLKPEKKAAKNKHDVNVLLLRKHQSDRRDVLFVNDYEDSYELQSMLCDFSNGFTIQVAQKAQTIDGSQINVNNLNPSFYFQETFVDPLLGELVVYAENMTHTVPLGNLAELINGVNIPSNEIDYTNAGQYRLLRVSDFDEYVFEQQLTSANIHSAVYERTMLREGDILMSARGQSIKIAQVKALASDKPIVVTQNTYIIRAHEPQMSDYLTVYLKSPVAQVLLKKMQKGANMKLLALKDLNGLPVKQVEDEKREKIIDGYYYFRRLYEEQLNELLQSYAANMLELYKEMDIKEYFERLKR